MLYKTSKATVPLITACAVLFLACSRTASQSAKPSLRITSPLDHTLVRPGQTLSVEVEAVGHFGMVAINGRDPFGIVGPMNASSPYRFDIQIPSNITPGIYTLTAEGAIAPGAGTNSKPISIDVERPDHPISVKIEPSYSLNLEVGGQTALSVIGTYVDGSRVYLTDSTQTTFVSQSPSIVAVNRGLVIAKAPGSTRILINKDIVVEVTVHSPKR